MNICIFPILTLSGDFDLDFGLSAPSTFECLFRLFICVFDLVIEIERPCILLLRGGNLFPS